MCVYVCMCVCEYMCVCVCEYMCVCVCEYMCVYLCMRLCKYVVFFVCVFLSVVYCGGEKFYVTFISVLYGFVHIKLLSVAKQRVYNMNYIHTEIILNS